MVKLAASYYTLEFTDIQDFDFTLLKQEVQDRHRKDDFGLRAMLRHREGDIHGHRAGDGMSWGWWWSATDWLKHLFQQHHRPRPSAIGLTFLWVKMGQICCAEAEKKGQGGNAVEVEAMSERVLRSGEIAACGGGNAVSSINSSSRQVSQATLPSMESKPTQLWDDEGSEVNPEEYENRTEEKPFAGHLGLGKGPFCAQDAHRAGFYSVLNPPNEGDEVVCFQRIHWLKRGIVTDVDVQVSCGKDGLKEGHEGAWVTVRQQDGSSFQTWAAFLATASENEYSSVCLQAEYENSNFHRLRRETYGSTVTHETRVTKSEARASLEKWLKAIVDADGEEVAINPAMHKE
eukprot:s5241_g1.t1